jgi:hypothetical protein
MVWPICSRKFLTFAFAFCSVASLFTINSAQAAAQWPIPQGFMEWKVNGCTVGIREKTSYDENGANPTSVIGTWVSQDQKPWCFDLYVSASVKTASGYESLRATTKKTKLGNYSSVARGDGELLSVWHEIGSCRTGKAVGIISRYKTNDGRWSRRNTWKFSCDNTTRYTARPITGPGLREPILW